MPLSPLQNPEMQILWRHHLRRIFRNLADSWIPGGLSGTGLITDLYDEAEYSGCLLDPLYTTQRPWVGMDRSESTVLKARGCLSGRKKPVPLVCVCDIRNPAFQNRCFDYILSHSTLDHFDDTGDIGRTVHELYRILKPGGRLLITLDNPANPVVFLRNLLPLPLLRFLGLVPYQIGRTTGRRKLAALLEHERFSVQQMIFFDHEPRFITIMLGRWLRAGSGHLLRNAWDRFMRMCESMSRWPTAPLTGYFYAILAIKSFEP